MNDVQKAIAEIEFKQGPALTCEWSVGFHDRGHGHGDFAVICDWEEGEWPIVIVRCPTKEIADHIVETHNAAIAERSGA